MANDKNFVVKNGLTAQEVKFVDATNTTSPTNTITASMLTSGTLSFSGSAGQLFSITDDLSGTIFAVNDVSGIPAIEVDDDGTIRFAESFGNVLIGTNVDDGTNKLQVTGNVKITGDLSVTGSIDAETLDGIDSTQFIRSDANDSSTGTIAFGINNIDPDSYASSSGGFGTIYDGSGWSARGVFVTGGTGKAAAMSAGSGSIYFGTQDGTNTNSMATWLQVTQSTKVANFTVTPTVAGNAVLTTASTIGSATNADTVDSLHASSFIRSDANDSFSGAITGAGSIDITGNIGGAVVSADTRFETTYNTNDGTVKMLGYGLEMSRVSSYIRPTADNTQTLYIGGADATLDWNTVDIKATTTKLSSNDLYFDGTNTYLRSDNQFQFLTDAGGAQDGRFKGIQVSTSYSGTVPSNGILFGTDTTLYRYAANVLATGTTDSFVVPDGKVGVRQGTPKTDINIGELHDSPNEANRILNWYATTGGTEIGNANIGLSYVNDNNSTDQPRAIGVALANKSSTDQVWSPAITFGAESTSGNYMTGSAAIAAQNFANGDTNFRGGDLHFFTSGVTNSSPDTRGLVSRMVIDNEGHVGIGTVSPVDPFEVHGTAGQLFAVTDDLTGTIFSVNDVSGVPSIEVEDSGDIKLARFAGAVLVGTGTSTGAKLDVVGNATIDGLLSVSDDVTGERFNSTVADGTTPFSVNSTTTVTNLSADYVDGLHASQFLRSDATGTASGQITFTNKVIIDHNTGTMFTIQATNGSPWAMELGRDDATNSKVFNGGGYWSFEHLPRWHNGGGSQILSLAHSKDIARSLGWVPGYNSSDEYSVLWNNTEDAVELYSGTDTGIGAIHQAVFIPSGQRVRFSVMVKGSATATSGLYLRLYAYNGTSLPNGKTHVSSDTAGGSSALVQEDSSGDTGWTENVAVPTAWTTYSREYTAAQDVMVSLTVLNWSGFGGSLYIKQPTIDIVKAADAEKLDGVNGASYLRSDVDDTYTGDLTHVGGAVFGSGTLTADGQNDIFMFATSPTSATAQSGAFHNKLRLLGGSSQTRDLQLYQVDSEYAHIGSSWTSNQLYFDSAFTLAQHNQRLIVSENQNTTAQTSPHLHLKASATTDSTGLTAIRLDTSTVDGYGITLAGARKGTDGTPTFSLRTHYNSAGGTEVFTIDNAGRATIKSTGIADGAVHRSLTLDGTFNVATIDSNDRLSIGFSVTNSGGGNQTRDAIIYAYDDQMWLNSTGDAAKTYIGSNGSYFVDEGTSHSKIGKISSISFGRGDGGGNWDSPEYHGIRSTEHDGNWGDDISINSYHNITLRLDSNANNSDGYVRIMNNTTGGSTIHYFGHNGTNPISAFSGLLQVGDTSTPTYSLDMALNGSTTDTSKIRFGINNGDAGGTTNLVGGGVIWAPKYTGYTKTSAGILQIGEGNYFRSGLAFYTNNTADQTTAMVERMRIDMDGNVGIGIAEPTNKFEVAGTNGQLFSVADDMTGTIFSVNDASGVPSIEVDDTGVVRLAEFVGNVLVGTATDDGTNKLQVNGSIRAIQSSGDGGFVLREWPGGSSYASLQTNGMSGNEYVVISNGTDTYISSGSGGTTYIRGPANDNTPQIEVSSSTASINGNRILTTADEGTGNGLDADTVDGIQGASFLRSDASDTFTGGDLYIGTSTTNNRLILQKAANAVSDHLIFYSGTTRIGEIGTEDTTWLRINQETAKNIYTPRYFRADGGLYVDSTSYGINGSGRLLDASFSGTYTNSIAFSNSYNSFGNDAGNATYNNTGTWNGRLNVIGTQHARIDAVSASDGIITTMYAHTGHGVGRVGTTSNHPIAFMVSNSIKAQLDAYGLRVGDGSLGKDVFCDKIWVGFSGALTGTTGNAYIHSDASGQMKFTTYVNTTATLGMTLTNGDLVVAGNVTSFSDARLKTNVKTIENSLDKVMNMRGVNYNRLDLDDKYDAGVIAQEMQEVAPELVTENEEHLSVNYAGISGYLIEAMKEQQKLIESLTKKVEELEAKLNKE